MLDNIFLKQKIMRRVLLSLLPIFLFSSYLYGWRPLILLAVSYIFGTLTEYVVEKGRGKKVSEAVLVTCTLYALSLPPATPIWIAIVGIVFGVFIGKELFGGFGRNIFNPAIVGRLFIYITFPTKLSSAWLLPGAFGAIGAASGGVDALTAATPLVTLRAGEQLPNLMNTLFGLDVPQWFSMFLGFRAGSIGESSILLILIGAIYLLATKTAQWRLIASTIITEVVLISIFYFSGLTPFFRPDYALMSGSLLYVAIFMCTDPVSAPNKPLSQWAYGIIIGSSTVIIRSFAGFPEGTSFAVMIGNVFSSLLDEMFPKKKKAKKKGVKKLNPTIKQEAT